jgi:hypothetical protein
MALPEEDGLGHVTQYSNRYLANIVRQQEMRALARLVVRLERRQEATTRLYRRHKTKMQRAQDKVAAHCRLINTVTQQISEAEALLAPTEARFRRAS